MTDKELTLAFKELCGQTASAQSELQRKYNNALPPSHHDFFIPRAMIERKLISILVDSGVEAFLPKVVESVRSGDDDFFFPLRTTGDGNCLTSALSRALWGSETWSMMLREAMTKELEENEEYYRSADSSGMLGADTLDENWNEILEIAKTPRQYLGSVHILALCHVIKRPIILYASDIRMKSFGTEVAASFVPARLNPAEMASKRPVPIAWAGDYYQHYVPLVGVEGYKKPIWPLLDGAFETSIEGYIFQAENEVFMLEENPFVSDMVESVQNIWNKSELTKMEDLKKALEVEKKKARALEAIRDENLLTRKDSAAVLYMLLIELAQDSVITTGDPPDYQKLMTVLGMMDQGGIYSDSEAKNAYNILNREWKGSSEETDEIRNALKVLESWNFKRLKDIWSNVEGKKQYKKRAWPMSAMKMETDRGTIYGRRIVFDEENSIYFDDAFFVNIPIGPTQGKYLIGVDYFDSMFTAATEFFHELCYTAQPIEILKIGQIMNTRRAKFSSEVNELPYSADRDGFLFNNEHFDNMAIYGGYFFGIRRDKSIHDIVESIMTERNLHSRHREKLTSLVTEKLNELGPGVGAPKRTRPSYCHFPAENYIRVEMAFDSRGLNKIHQCNESQDLNGDLRLNENELSGITSLVEFIQKTRESRMYHKAKVPTAQFEALSKAIRTWPPTMVFPLLDILRSLLMEVAQSDEVVFGMVMGAGVLETACGILTNDQSSRPSILITTRLLTALVACLSCRKLVVADVKVLNAITISTLREFSLTDSMSLRIREATSFLLYNIVLALKDSNSTDLMKGQLCVQSLLKLLENEERENVLLSILISIGTLCCHFLDVTQRENIEKALIRIEKTAQNGSKIAICIADIHDCLNEKT